jgi:uncharacterized protein YbaP (TraB family)
MSEIIEIKNLLRELAKKENNQELIEAWIEIWNQGTRTMIEDLVFEAYEKELKSMGETLVNLKRQKAPTSGYGGDDY